MKKADGRKRAKEMRKDGKRFREIGEIFGFHLNTVAHWLPPAQKLQDIGITPNHAAAIMEVTSGPPLAAPAVSSVWRVCRNAV